MYTQAAVFLGIGVCTAVMTMLVRRHAHHIGGIDVPDLYRKNHSNPVPSLGGVAIYAGFIAGIAFIYFFEGQLFETIRWSWPSIFGLCLAATLVFALGVYDDLRGANFVKKLSFQIGAATLLYAFDFRIEHLSYPFGFGETFYVSLGWLSFPVTVLWLVGLSNAINLIDGHDGLAGGVVCLAAVALMITSSSLGHPDTAWLYLILAAATLGFLIWNLPPASIFMGDSGALFLGFLIAALAIKGSVKGPASVSLIIPIVALCLPVTDVSLTLLRRFLMGQPLVNADRQHIHHLLLDKMSLNQWKSLGLLYGVSLAGCGMAITYLFIPNTLGWLPLVFLTILVGWLLLRSGYADVLRYGLRPAAWRLAYNIWWGRRQMKRTECLDDMEQVIRIIARRLDCDAVEFHIVDTNGTSGINGTTDGHNASENAPHVSEFPLPDGATSSQTGWRMQVPLKGKHGLVGQVSFRKGHIKNTEEIQTLQRFGKALEVIMIGELERLSR